MPSYRIRQKFWSVGDNFKIENAEDESDFYIVKGKVFSWGDKLAIFNADGEEIIKIEQHLLHLHPTYKILKDGKEFATVKKAITFFKDKFTMDVPGDNDYTIKGNVIDHEYQFTRSANPGVPVAQVSKKFFAWTDSYAVKIDKGEDIEAILACCIVIDQCSHDNDH